MTLDEFFKLRIALEAFSRRDIQTAGVILDWIMETGFTVEQFHLFSKMMPHMDQFERLGVFSRVQSVEQSKAIRQFERTLLKNIAKDLRRLRLQHSYSGPIDKSG